MAYSNWPCEIGKDCEKTCPIYKDCKGTKENEKINQYMLSQGYDANCAATNDYIQKTDDCDWVF